jgi:hypothetical protein
MFRSALIERGRRAIEHMLAAADAALAFEEQPTLAEAAPFAHPHRRAASVPRPARRRGAVPPPTARCLSPQTRRAASQAARALR